MNESVSRRIQTRVARCLGLLLLVPVLLTPGCDSGDAEPPGDEARTPAPPLPGLVLKWADEFDGDALDRALWKPNDRYIQNGQNTCHMDDPANIEVSDGTLKLNVLPGVNPCDKPFTGARLESLTRADRFVYFEARIRYPNPTEGFWGNFWTIGHDGSTWRWPPEFDMAEMTSNHPRRIFQAYQHRGGDWNGPNTDVNAWTVLDWTDWHVYGADWTADAPVTFYVDGEPVLIADSAPVWDQFQYLVLRMGASHSDSWGGTPGPSTTYPGVAEYDWVRVWWHVP